MEKFIVIHAGQFVGREKKEITYNLGSVLEKAGRPAEAVKHFESIFEHDINYRDVEKKVSDYHNRQGGAA